MDKITLQVEGLSCAHCVRAVTNAVEALDGIVEVKVFLESKTVDVVYDADKVSLEVIKDAIEEEGYNIL